VQEIHNVSSAWRRLAGFLLALAPGLCRAETLAVLYPEVDEPYLSVFRSIARGVEQGSDARVLEYRLRKDEPPEAVSSWLRSQKVDGAVSLGTRGYKLALSLGSQLPTVVGGLPIAPNGVSGVSLVPAPEAVLGQLKGLAPGVSRVHLVYGPGSEWLIPLARTAAEARGLTLDARRAASLSEAARIYAELLPRLRGVADALWLLTDPVVTDDLAILPAVLKAAWSQGFVLFSSTPAHLKRGVLFTPLPDNAAMGERLARLLAEVRANPGLKAVLPAERVGLAVNLRTAGHLGLSFSAAQERAFQVVFPPR
jgi:putative ABC transport system substrate-binding protein